MVSAGRPAAERAWLMSARTWAAALPEEPRPEEAPAGFVADAAGAGLADADADGDGVRQAVPGPGG